LSESFDDETVVFRPDHLLLHLSAPKQKGRYAAPSSFDLLRDRLTSTLERHSFRPRLSSLVSQYSEPVRRSVRRGGSTVLTGVAAVLLLLAAVKLSGGTPPPVTVIPATAPVQESTRAAKEQVQARRFVSAAVDFTPTDPGAQFE